MIHNKVSYLLKAFKDDEWSGPAWYKILKAEKTGFPTEVELVYFKPIHLGHGTETEIDGEKLGKLLPKMYKQMPDLKDCYLGLIHSHHTMGAFLSGTDKDTAREQATSDGFFFSTVVASEKDPYDCCFTYKDRYGYSNLIEGKVKVMMPKITVPKDWVAEARAIKKEKKKESKVSYINNANQLSFVNNTRGYVHGGYGYGGYGSYYDRDVPEKKDDDEKKTLSSWDKETEISQEEINKMEEISQEFIDGMITYHQLIERVNKECPNINPYDYMDGRGNGTDWY